MGDNDLTNLGLLNAEAKRLLGDDVLATQLDGEHDLNARVELPDGSRRLLKVHRPGADLAELDLQDSLLAHLTTETAKHLHPLAPRLLHRGITTHGERVVRVLDWIDGPLWSAHVTVSPPTERGFGAIGHGIALLDAALNGFTHSALDRPLRWNMMQAAGLLPGNVELSDSWAASTLCHFVAEVLPRLQQLPNQAIHNDANENNIVISDDEPGSFRVSLIDFGDVISAPKIVGLAVGIAYAMSGQADPLHAALPMVAAYHQEAPLQPEELALLDSLVRTRLAMSIAIAELQVREQPENAAYLTISQSEIRATVERLHTLESSYAHFAYRDACGFRAVPRGRFIQAYFESPQFDPAPLVDADLSIAIAVDYSTETMATRGTRDLGDSTYQSSDRSSDRVTLGRYREDRSVYDAEAFATPSGERRTVHLGVDIMLPAGTAVYAPLDGLVFHSDIRPDRGDYGGVLMLQHETPEGVPFWLLLGHLSHSSSANHPTGTAFKRGDLIGHVGERTENGGWAPHIHAHLYIDTLGRNTDLPGVVRRSQVHVWDQIAPNPSPLLRGVDAATVEVPRASDAAIISRRRRTALSASLSLSYNEPLHIVRGSGASLFDAAGNEWLDLVNNVAHVGHEHPEVVAALQQQIATLNTNTRYLHPLVVEYAEQIRATLPDPLSVVFFTNSGSEANDLALRIARIATGHEGVVALDWGYHGNLSSLVDISAYKFNRKGGRGQKPWVRLAELPDPYRGEHGDDGSSYAASVRTCTDELRDSQHGVAAFIHESISGCGGQVDLATGYLPAAYDYARTAGAICIADEVQTGLGRVGSHWWAFERQGVVPDIVTMGKPLGNGHPLGIVVTTPELARKFRTGMEYFNTFGGNPVSCAAGLAVLSVIRQERLRANAETVGAHMKEGLQSLQATHSCIGEVRGAGLFLGVDLVKDRGSRTPDTRLAKLVLEAMKARGVLISSDGPADNVLKIKPPMVLSAGQADRAVSALDEALRSLT